MTVSVGTSLGNFATASAPPSPGAMTTVPPQYTDIGDITVTAVISETPEYEVEVTEYPVEAGANVSDHARPKLIRISIDGMFSNLVSPGDQSVRQGDQGGSDFAATGAPMAPGFVQAARAYLLGLVSDPRPIAIVTPDKTYPAMILTSLKLPRFSNMGEAQKFSASFKEWRVTTVQKTPTAIRLARVQKKGLVTPKRLEKPEDVSAAAAAAGGGRTKEDAKRALEEATK